MGDTTARATPVRTGYELVVRPRAALLRTTALSVVFSAVPLGVALVWVALPPSLLALVATVIVALALVTGGVFVRLRIAFVGVGSERVEVRNVLRPRVVVDRRAIDRVVLATTIGSGVDRTTREFLALASDGTPLVRLRGDLWDDADIARVVGALGVQVTEIAKPMSVREFHRRFPTIHAWYEGRRGFVTVGVVAGLFVLSALVAETTGLLAR